MIQDILQDATGSCRVVIYEPVVGPGRIVWNTARRGPPDAIATGKKILGRHITQHGR